MALLNFKYGPLNNLKTKELAPGTIYVTNDERAMYVDLPDASATGGAKRIRLGDVRIFDYKSEMEDAIKADLYELTKSALYYVEKDKITDEETGELKDVVINALFRYNGSKFIQLNAVSEITADLNGIKEDISNLETSISELKEIVIPENGKSIDQQLNDESTARKAADDQHTADISKNTENISKNTADISKNAENIGKNATAITDLTTTHNAFEETVEKDYLKKADAEDLYQTIAYANDTYATKDELNTAKTNLIGTVNDASGVDTIGSAKKMAQDAATLASDAQTTANTALEDAGKAQKTINDYKASNDEALASVTNIANAAATKTALDAEIERAQGAEQGNAGNIAELNTRVGQIETYFAATDATPEVIDTFNEIVSLITADDTGSAALLAKVNTHTENIGDLDSRLDEAETDISNLEAKDTELATDIAEAITETKTYAEGLLTWGQF